LYLEACSVYDSFPEYLVVLLVLLVLLVLAILLILEKCHLRWQSLVFITFMEREGVLSLIISRVTRLALIRPSL
jgi:hypothetical protein